MEHIIVKPWITEKATALQPAGQYVFLVAPAATKNEVKKAIQVIYKVAVVGVTILNRAGKAKRFRATKTVRAGYRKAVVTLKKGDTIDIGV